MEMINSLVAKLQNVLSDLPGQASKPTVEVHAEAACEETAVQGAAVVRHVASPDCNSCGVVYDAVMELHLREGKQSRAAAVPWIESASIMNARSWWMGGEEVTHGCFPG